MGRSFTCTPLNLIYGCANLIAITPPRIAQFRSNLVQSFITSQAIHCKCSRSEVKGQRLPGQRSSQRKVMYQRQKHYNYTTVMDKFKLGMASQLSGKGLAWRWVTSTCNAFAIATFSSFFYLYLDRSFETLNAILQFDYLSVLYSAGSLKC